MSESSDLTFCSQCARACDPDRNLVPIKLDLDAEIVGGLDGFCHYEAKTRKAIVEEAVSEYIQRRLREISLILKLAGRNPPSAD